MNQVSVPLSLGELIDKITILEIKSERIKEADKLKNIHQELQLLRATWMSTTHASKDIEELRARLKAINGALWEIEDEIRLKEAHGEFDNTFIELARAVYRNNDERAAIKRQLNEQLGSDIIEEKSYVSYRRTN